MDLCWLAMTIGVGENNPRRFFLHWGASAASALPKMMGLAMRALWRDLARGFACGTGCGAVSHAQGPPRAGFPRLQFVRTETPPQSVQYTTSRLHVGNSVQAYPSHSQVKVKKTFGPIITPANRKLRCKNRGFRAMHLPSLQFQVPSSTDLPLKCFIRSFRSRPRRCLSFSQPISGSAVP